MKKRETNIKVVTATVFIATFMTAIEATILSTAMPMISSILHGGEIMSWVFSIYLLANAMMTPIYGKLTDSIGRKPIFQIGICLFILGSLLCGLADSMIELIIFRAVQGIGAGAIMPVALTIIADIYPPEKRAKLLGLNSAAWGIASVVGPLVGGFIVDKFSWHWIFFVNLPIGIILMVLLHIFLQEPKREQKKQPIDIKGSIVLMLFLLAFLYAFQTISDNNGFSLMTAFCFMLVLILGFTFYKVEDKAVDPVIPLFLLRNGNFVIVNVLAALVSGYLMGLDVYIPMWMQGVLGMKASIGGLALTPLSITWILGSFVAGKLTLTRSTKYVLNIGLGIILLGSICMAFLPMETSFLVFCLITALIGLGLGITITSATVKAQTSVATEYLGVATSFNTLSRTIGQSIMISVYSVVLNYEIKQQLTGTKMTRQMVDNLSNHENIKNIGTDLLTTLRHILYEGLHHVFLFGVLLLVISLGLNLLLKSNQNKDAKLSK